jgi:alkylated DNA repair dioxygenase AlkB
MPRRSAQAPIQPSLFEAAPAMPDGFRHRADLITADEEATLLAWLRTLEFKPYEFQGYLANRRVVSFGLRYDDRTRQVGPAAAIPGELHGLRRRAADFAGVEADALRHVLINEYRVGAPIGWHRDRPQFEAVVGVSLLSPCTFRLRRRTGAGFERASLRLEPRSAYVMRGPARDEWEHSIPPAGELRYSVTLRTVRAGVSPAD